MWSVKYHLKKSIGNTQYILLNRILNDLKDTLSRSMKTHVLYPYSV